MVNFATKTFLFAWKMNFYRVNINEFPTSVASRWMGLIVVCRLGRFFSPNRILNYRFVRKLLKLLSENWTIFSSKNERKSQYRSYGSLFRPDISFACRDIRIFGDLHFLFQNSRLEFGTREGEQENETIKNYPSVYTMINSKLIIFQVTRVQSFPNFNTV